MTELFKKIKINQPLPHDRLYFPKGNYCIVKSAGFSCPSNFTEGYLNWNDENDNNKNNYYGAKYSKPDGVFGKDTQIKFCCRSDGNYRTAMNMPKDFSYTLFPHFWEGITIWIMSLPLQYIRLL